jgi:dihydroxyacid dehydratase/phosphogluconate dehydratase
MLHLRRLGLLHLDCLTALGRTLGDVLDEWEQSDRRRRFRGLLLDLDGIDPATVILDPDAARRAGMTGTLAFPVGNIAPQGSVVKSTAIDPGVLDADGVFRMRGRVRVFMSEAAAVAAVKSPGPEAVAPGDIIVLAGCGPMGTGMEETYQLTSALTHVPWGKQVAVLTDARFSGVSTGACIGHISPEALAGGPIGKLVDGDIVRIVIDGRTLGAAIDLVGQDGDERDEVWGRSELERRAERADIRPDPRLPADTRLWVALQDASGGAWGGCVYDVDAILDALEGAKEGRNGGT